MSTGTRFVVILFLVIAVAAVAWMARRARTARSYPLVDTGLAPGVYLFTSDDCASCEEAARLLTDRDISFSRVSWQANPDLFDRLRIDAVPSVGQVGEDGSGRWWLGVPPRLG